MSVVAPLKVKPVEPTVLFVSVPVESRVTTVPDPDGKVNVVESVPERVSVLLTITVFPSPILSVVADVKAASEVFVTVSPFTFSALKE